MPKNERNSSDTDQRITQILQGKETIVTYHGLSQYTGSNGDLGEGSSACGLACFNCARLVLSKERNGMQGMELLSYLIKRETFEVSILIGLKRTNVSIFDRTSC